MTDLPGHFEAFLGTIDAGWSSEAFGGSTPFQVARFTGPVGGGVPFATLGVSHHLLAHKDTGKQFRQELVIPIAHAEAHYVFERGWRSFEDRLMEIDPDLVQVNRQSIV